MAEFNQEYSAHGFTDVVVIDHREHEEAGGFQDEHVYETVIAKRENECWLLEAHSVTRFGPRSKRDFSLSKSPISQQQYDSLKAKAASR